MTSTVFDKVELQDSIRQFLERSYPFESRRRQLADPDLSARGEHWSSLEEIGLIGMNVPEDAGGLGAGIGDVMAAAEELGRGLVAEPWIGCAVLAPTLLDLAADDAMRRSILPEVTSGRLVLALAHEEAEARGEITLVATRATRSGEGYRLSGRKIAIAGGPLADRLLVSARTGGDDKDRDGISLFLVDPAAPGVRMTAYRGYDGQALASIEMDGVQPITLIGSEGAAAGPLEQAALAAVLAHCAFALGIMDRALEATAEYLQTRRQFGKALSEFQVLRHRLVDARIEAEKTRAILEAAPVELRDGSGLEAVALARLVTLRAAHCVSRSCTQLHGGIGLTEEYHVGHCTRWLTAAAVQFGSADWWRQQAYRQSALAAEAA